MEATGARAEIHVDGSPARRVMDRANAVADALRLRNPLLEAAGSRHDPIWIAPDFVDLTLGRDVGHDADGTGRGRVGVWIIDGPEELSRTVSDLSANSDPREVESWNLLRNCHRSFPAGEGAFFLAASRDGKTADGILLAGRSTDVHVDHERVWSAEYVVRGDFIFVAGQARGKSVAATLTACLCDQMGTDLDDLARSLAASGRRIELGTRIIGESHSDGGERFFEALLDYYDAYVLPNDIRGYARLADEAEADYSV
jgi:hypothetical protein